MADYGRRSTSIYSEFFHALLLYSAIRMRPFSSRSSDFS